MGQRIPTPPLAESDKKPDSLLVIFATLGGTTWRMFVPVILGALLGYWIDGQYSTKYGAVTGAVTGLVLAGVLVWKQYTDVTKDKNS